MIRANQVHMSGCYNVNKFNSKQTILKVDDKKFDYINMIDCKHYRCCTKSQNNCNKDCYKYEVIEINKE